ncbi:hypothetical protein B6U99_02840 [Candidatus Geothermarchaeota archaeon ex4572_27]|nr:MAG: hypothetical protein B6U99_02840 [Candidatus Geothermarchaeota archaeon ex4572_27]
MGRYTAIEDCVVIHGGGDPAKEPIEPVPVIIGSHCTIGHGAIIHSCTIEDYVLVGMNAVIHTGAVIGEGSIVAMGSVVEKGARIPPRTLGDGRLPDSGLQRAQQLHGPRHRLPDAQD